MKTLERLPKANDEAPHQLKHALLPSSSLPPLLHCSHLTAVLDDIVAVPAAREDLLVVPAHEPQTAAVRLPLGVVHGHVVLAVVGDVLLGVCGQQLQEADLVPVRLVGELE